MSKFCKLLRESIMDEKKAPKDYAKLANTLMKEAGGRGREEGEDLRRDVDIIHSIMQDEGHHHVALTAMNNRRCK